MKLLRLFPLELGRLLHSRMTWLIVLLTVISPAVGLVLYKPAIASTMLSMYLANPALAGGAAGGILFGLLTVYELDRAGRSRVEVLTNAVVSPLAAALVRLPALLAAAGLALVLTMLVWLPISCGLIGSIFDGGDYVLAYLLFMGLALPLSILAASAAYQYTRRADLSLVLFAAFAALSLTVWADNWQLCWLNPCVWALSDDFSNFRIFRSVAWMRLTWLAALAGIWTVSYLCIRQYGKGLPGSLARSVRRAHRPIIALSLLACSGFAYAAQPLVDHSNPDQTVMDFYQVPYAENVVCTSRSAQVFPDTTAGTVSGTAAYRFRNTSGQAWTAAFGVNPGYTISNVRVNGAEVPFSVSDYQEYNEAMLEVALPSDREIELTMDYGGFPRENRNVSIMQGGTEISSEYLCLENAGLSPRLINVLPGENGYPTTIEITLPASMSVIPFGASKAEVVALCRGLHPPGYPGRRHGHRILLRPQASGRHGGRRGGGGREVGGGLLYSALRHVVLRQRRYPEAHSEPGDRRRLRRKRRQSAGRGRLHRRQSERYRQGRRSRRSHDPRTGPSVVGPWKHV